MSPGRDASVALDAAGCAAGFTLRALLIAAEHSCQCAWLFSWPHPGSSTIRRFYSHVT